MNKIFLIASFLFISIAAGAAEINFMTNPVWNSVLSRAKAEKKLIFLDAYATWCGPCKKMDSEVYTDQAVADYYNSKFINVKYDMETGEGKTLAEKFRVMSYPSLLFVNEDGKIVHKGIGYLVPAEFIALGKTAVNPETQYAAIKLKAPTLSPAEFILFAIAASEFGDEDYDEIARAYLSKQPDVLAGDDLISIVMKGVTYLPDEKVLAYIINNKSKIEANGKFSPEEIRQRMIGLTLAYAAYSNTSSLDGKTDLAAVNALLEKYIPADAYFVFNYFKTQYSLERGDKTEALAAFKNILEGPVTRISFEQLSNTIIAFGAVLEPLQSPEKAFAKLDAYPVTAADQPKLFMRDLVKAVTWLKLKNNEKFKVYSAKLLESKDTPEEVKVQLRTVAAQLN